MTVKGWPTQKKDQVNSSNQFATVQPLDQDKYGLDVHASNSVVLIATDLVETGSTASSIVATAHPALLGDILLFTSGAASGQQVRVLSVTTNAIVITPVSTAPSNGDGFRILRHRNTLVDSTGQLQVTASVSAGPIAYTRDSASTPVSEDTGTPANSRPLPIKILNASGVVQGSSAVPLRTDPTGTTAQPITDNGGSITVDGAVTVSGTVAATQSGTWNVTNVSGTVSLPTGAATEASLVKLPLAQNTTTSGQSGTLMQGAATAGVPTYSTGTTNPLSLTTGGSLRVSVTAIPTVAVDPSQPQSSTATLSNVAASATSVTVLAAAAGIRKMAMLHNDSTAILYLKFGAAASTTSYTVKIAPDGYYELPGGSIYSGIISGIWSSATGNARVTELT